MKKLLFATLVGATSVAAQITGDMGRGMYGKAGKAAGTGMMSKGGLFFSFNHVLMMALFLGLTILVWQWVFKTWRDLKKK